MTPETQIQVTEDKSHDQDKTIPVEWTKALINFISSKCHNTSKAYHNAIINFFGIIRVAPDKITPFDVSAYKQLLKKSMTRIGRPIANATIELRLSALSSFYNYCCDPEMMQDRPLAVNNPFKVIGRKDIAISKFDRSRKMLIEDFKNIAGQIDRSTEKGKRDYALLMFYVHTGRRKSEVVKLKFSDLELGKESSYRYTGKGMKSAKRLLPAVAADALREYVSTRKNKKPDDYVFLPMNRYSTVARDEKTLLANSQALPVPGMNSRSVLRMVKFYAERAGIDASTVTVHSMRHLAAQIRRDLGADLEEIQLFLDHESMDTTQVYTRRVLGIKDVDRSSEVQKIITKE